MLTRASLYFHTIRHMTARQILTRIAVRTKRKFLEVSQAGTILYRSPPATAAAYSHTNTPVLPALGKAVSGPLSPLLEATIKSAGEDLRNGRFSFVGEVSEYSNEIDWNDEQRSRLWRLNLHYFDSAPLWVLDAIINQNGDSFSHWKRVVDSWITQNRIGQFEAWNPYSLSLRIPNWILAYQLAELGGIADPEFSHKLLRSIYQQASYLYSNVEWDLPMNHLAANGRGLFYAGVFFRDTKATRWLNRGKKLLWQRLDADVCGDGGHAERSPMYHLLVLQDCLECYAISLNAGIPWPASAVGTIRKMVEFSAAIEHPDGDIPLFNDSAIGIAIQSNEIVSIAHRILGDNLGTQTAMIDRPRSLLGTILNSPEPKKARSIEAQENRFSSLIQFPETGYYVIADPRREMKLIFDCGEVGIREVAGHAHSDLLSYELSVAGERVIVDSGTSTYSHGPRRQYERSIAAHNTVSVDGKDTCEPWGDYRLARRGHPGPVRSFEKDGVQIIDAGHQSFLERRDVIHRRAIINILDHIIVFDRILGRGICFAEARLLFHPDVRLEPLAGSTPTYAASGRAASLAIRCFGTNPSLKTAADDRLVGWYAPRFGELLPTTLIEMKSNGRMPLLLGHVISAIGSTVRVSTYNHGWKLELENQHSRVELALDDSGLSITGSVEVAYEWL